MPSHYARTPTNSTSTTTSSLDLPRNAVRASRNWQPLAIVCQQGLGVDPEIGLLAPAGATPPMTSPCLSLATDAAGRAPGRALRDEPVKMG